MDRIFSFLGQAFLAFLPVIVIQGMALSDLTFAAELSQAFAVVSVWFSVFYMAQRQYVNINGPVDGDVNLDIRFRLSNIALAALIAAGILYSYSIAFYVAFFAIAVKSSESILDYLYGYYNHELGFSQGARRFFALSLSRFFILIASLLTSFLYLQLGFDQVSYITGSVSLILLGGFVLDFYRSLNRAPKDRFTVGYYKRVKILFPFSLSASLCAFLVVLPRWLVEVGSSENNIFLVAFSLVPVFGVLFNTFFASYIELAKTNIRRSFLKLVAVVVGINVLFYFSGPLFGEFVKYVYCYDESIADLFFDAVRVGVLFFSAILFANYYKFSRPYLEGLTYLSGALVLIVLSKSGVPIYESIMISSITILLLSVFSLKVEQ